MAKKITKKPMTVRLSPSYEERFRALATVRNVDYDVMFIEVVKQSELNLNAKDRIAYEALLDAWGIDLEHPVFDGDSSEE